eukprot:773246-Rhodomonas_salina.1
MQPAQCRQRCSTTEHLMRSELLAVDRHETAGAFAVGDIAGDEAREFALPDETQPHALSLLGGWE